MVFSSETRVSPIRLHFSRTQATRSSQDSSLRNFQSVKETVGDDRRNGNKRTKTGSDWLCAEGQSQQSIILESTQGSRTICPKEVPTGVWAGSAQPVAGPCQQPAGLRQAPGSPRGRVLCTEPRSDTSSHTGSARTHASSFSWACNPAHSRSF